MEDDRQKGGAKHEHKVWACRSLRDSQQKKKRRERHEQRHREKGQIRAYKETTITKTIFMDNNNNNILSAMHRRVVERNRKCGQKKESGIKKVALKVSSTTTTKATAVQQEQTKVCGSFQDEFVNETKLATYNRCCKQRQCHIFRDLS